MGVEYNQFLGGYTPACNQCGVHLCWDISENEYEEDKQFWEDWICQDCNGGVRLKRNHNDKH